MNNKSYQKSYNKLKIKHAIELVTLELEFENNIDPNILYNSLHECKNFTKKEFQYILNESKKKIKNKNRLK